jgi:hypothetical protein
VTTRLRSRWATAGRGDEGSAIVEFVFLAVLMLVPIVYLIVVLARIQAGALAAEQGAREAGRAFVTAADDQSAPVRARAAAALAYRDQGFAPPAPDQLTITCGSSPCLTAGARVRVVTRVTIGLPGVPRFLTHVMPVAVTVTATHVATVDEFSVQ